MRPFEKTESHQSIIPIKVTAVLSCAILICQARIFYRWAHTSLNPGENLAKDVLGGQWDSIGQLVRMPQDQPQNLPSDTCHPSGETLCQKHQATYCFSPIGLK